MGIDGFNKFMRENSAASFVSIRKGQQLQKTGVQCGRLYVDCNDLLHQAARRAADEFQLFDELFALLDGILASCRPSKSVVLALDGPGPYAKVLEQRKRRANTGRKASSERGRSRRGRGFGRGYGRSGGRGRAFGSRAPLSGSDLKQALTPGTELMHRLTSSLMYWAESKLVAHNHAHAHSFDSQKLRFFITGSDVPGEGEMKILAHLYHQAKMDGIGSSVDRSGATATGPAASALAGQHDPSNFVVVGGDADLLVMAVQADIPGLYVLQPDQATRGWQLFSTDSWIADIKQRVMNAAKNKAMPHPLADVLRTVRQDFAMLALLEGNDYLPALPGARLRRTWPRYLRTRGAANWTLPPLAIPGPARYEQGGETGRLDLRLSNRSCWHHIRPQSLAWVVDINWPLFNQLVNCAPDDEDRAPADGRSRSNSTTLVDNQLHTSEGATESGADSVAITGEDVCRAGEFVQGLLWCLNCYRTGRCHDYSFFLSSEARPVAEHVVAFGLDQMEKQKAATYDPAAKSDAATFAQIRRAHTFPTDSASSRALLSSAPSSFDAQLSLAYLNRRTPQRLPLRPHEMLLLLLPLSSKHLLPAPLQSLAEPGYASPLGILYAMEVDAHLATLQAKCREVSQEAQRMRDKLLGPYKAGAGGSAKAKIRLPEELRARITAAHDAMMEYKQSMHPPINLRKLLPRIRAAVDSIPRGNYSQAETSHGAFGVARCVELRSGSDTSIASAVKDDPRLRPSRRYDPEPPPTRRFGPLPPHAFHKNRRGSHAHHRGHHARSSTQAAKMVLVLFDVLPEVDPRVSDTPKDHASARKRRAPDGRGASSSGAVRKQCRPDEAPRAAQASSSQSSAGAKSTAKTAGSEEASSWVRKISGRTGRPYFFNTATGQSQWTPPQLTKGVDGLL